MCLVIKYSNIKLERIMNYLIEDILRRPDTWQGIGNTDRFLLNPTVKPANSEIHSLDGFKTGFGILDDQLHNKGWPLGGCVEIISDDCGLDGMGLFIPMMQKLSGQHRWQVFIAPPYIPYAPLLAGEGIDLQGVMLVHPGNREELLWSTEQALRSSTCCIVFSWLGATDYRYAELRKIQLAAASHNILAVLFRSSVALNQHSPANLKIQLKGYRQIRILKQRSGSKGITIQLPFDEIAPTQQPKWSLVDTTGDSGLSLGSRNPT